MSKRVVALGLGAVLALAAPLIMKWEGVKYQPYRDAVGVLTVCYGHTGPDIVEGKAYSKDECGQLLDRDMRVAAGVVRRCLPIDMPRNVEAAFVSAAFNVGPRVVCGSTLQGYALASNWPAACAELDKWKYAGGRVYRGLVLRRADERAVCEGRE